MTQFLRTYAFTVAVLAMVVLRLALGVSMPLCIHAAAAYDDAWAVRAADFISQGQWLGPYDSIALIKNPGFPLFLAVCKMLHIDYLLGATLLTIGATLFFMWAIRPLFGRRWTFFLVLVVLLFCPVGFATDTFQRVYRNSISAAQTLIVFGGFIGMYLRCKSLRTPDPLRLSDRPIWRTVKTTWLRLLPWSLVGGLGLAWMWVTRGDGIWVAPFVAIATIVMVVVLARRRFRSEIPTTSAAAGALLVVLPLVLTVATVGIISAVNQQHYGISTTAEINSGNFARMVKDLYAIQPDEEPFNQRVACTHDSLQKAYEASPALASIKTEVEDCFYNFGDVIDNDAGDGEVNGGEFFWVFRRAADAAGLHTDAQTADAFYGKVADELEAAFASGKLAQRDTLPSSIMTPWRADFAPQLAPTFTQILLQAIGYGDVTCQPYVAQGTADGIAYFEQMTGNDGYVQGEPVPQGCAAGEAIIAVYRIIGPIIAVLGLACGLALLVWWLRSLRRENRPNWLGALVLCSFALFLGACTLFVGLAYSRVSSFIPINFYYYASAAYPLLLAAGGLSITGMIKLLFDHGD